MVCFEPSTIDVYADQLVCGQVGVFPCDTIWGLIGLSSESVISRIYNIKNRPETQPFLILLPDETHLSRFVDAISDSAAALIKAYWPGPLTIVFKKHRSVPDYLTSGLDTIAIRCPFFPPLNCLLDTLAQPLISTSVNLSGEPAIQNVSEISDEFKRKVDFIYSAVCPQGNGASTVVDCSGRSIRVLRDGVISLDQFELENA